jgi:hypothetical protein
MPTKIFLVGKISGSPPPGPARINFTAAIIFADYELLYFAKRI